MSKKLVSIIATAIMVIFSISVILVGCSTVKNNNTGMTDTISTSGKLESSQVTNANTEPVNIKWYTGGTKPEGLDAVITDLNKKLESKINATLDLQIIDFGLLGDKMTLIVNSGEIYDIAFTSSWCNTFSSNVAKGAFLSLDELIDTNAPKLRTDIPKSLLDVARVNGKIYAVPNNQAIYQAYGVYVQKNLLDKYNFDLDMVNTYTDLEPLLDTLVEKEPGLIPTRTIPQIQYLDNTYDYPMSMAVIHIDDPTYKVYSYLEPVKKIYDLKKAYADKGYLGKKSEVITRGDDTGLLKANKFAMMWSPTKPGGAEEMSQKQGLEYKMKQIQKPFLTSTAGQETMNAISVASKNPGKAIQVIELVNGDKEIYNELLYGIEDVNYTKLDENTIDLVPGSKYDLYTGSWAIGNVFNSFYLKGQSAGIMSETRKLNDTAIASPIRGFTFDSTPVTTEITKVGAVQEEYKSIWGLADYEAKWTEFENKAKAAGLDTIVAEVQKQLDAWLVANGKK